VRAKTSRVQNDRPLSHWSKEGFGVPVHLDGTNGASHDDDVNLLAETKLMASIVHIENIHVHLTASEHSHYGLYQTAGPGN